MEIQPYQWSNKEWHGSKRWGGCGGSGGSAGRLPIGWLVVQSLVTPVCMSKYPLVICWPPSWPRCVQCECVCMSECQARCLSIEKCMYVWVNAQSRKNVRLPNRSMPQLVSLISVCRVLRDTNNKEKRKNNLRIAPWHSWAAEKPPGVGTHPYSGCWRIRLSQHMSWTGWQGLR